MTILWVIEFDYASRNHHGAVIRYVNYAKELIRLGHRIYFAAEFQAKHREESRRWFEDLRDAGAISGWIEVQYEPQAGRASALAFFPSLGNRLHRKSQVCVANIVLAFVQMENIDAVIVSNRRLLFLIVRLPRTLKILADFGDSMALYYLRSVKAAFGQHAPLAAIKLLKPLLQYVLQERYYGRRSTRSIVVSPVDKSALDRLSGRPDRSMILLNGVRIPAREPDLEKIPFRIIFTGNMSFPPNYEGALWFLDFVFPHIQRELPAARLVLAGADPPQDLHRRASSQVSITGFVEDLNLEIARSSLFVAPLVSGGGFKNKVVEALANRTYIVASPLAVEFLDPAIRQLITVEADPMRMAVVIVELLRNPAQFADRLDNLHAFVRDRMSWSGRTVELLELLESTG